MHIISIWHGSLNSDATSQMAIKDTFDHSISNVATCFGDSNLRSEQFQRLENHYLQFQS